MHPIFWRFAGLAAPVGPLVAIIRMCAMTTKNLLIRAGAAAWYQVSGTRYLVPGIWYKIVPGTYLALFGPIRLYFAVFGPIRP